MQEIKIMYPKNSIIIAPGEMYIDKSGKPINTKIHIKCISEIKQGEFIKDKYRVLSKSLRKAERYVNITTNGKYYIVRHFPTIYYKDGITDLYETSLNHLTGVLTRTTKFDHGIAMSFYVWWDMIDISQSEFCRLIKLGYHGRNNGKHI